MKNKKMVLRTALLLFAIIGICNVINVSADQIEIPPISWFSQGFDVDCKDELEIYVSSSKAINVYVMNQEQLDTLIDSNGLTWDYIKRWKDMTYLEYTYVIQINGMYHVVIYNKNLVYSRIVDYQITVNYYDPYEPYEPDDPDETTDIPKNVFLFVIIPIAIIGVVVMGCTIFKIFKKAPKEVVIVQEREVPKAVLYCPECGTVVSDKKEYCSNCGSKIIKLKN